MNKLDALYLAMVRYYSGDGARIQHFVKVHSFAALIGREEGLDSDTLLTLEAAALVHDIGIKAAEEKYGSCTGKLQEKEGPPIARSMLLRTGFDSGLTERVCYLVAHHHTYTDVSGIDYRILLEADFLVNLFEESSGSAAVLSAYKNIFRTETGKKICADMFSDAFES